MPQLTTTTEPLEGRSSTHLDLASDAISEAPPVAELAVLAPAAAVVGWNASAETTGQEPLLNELRAMVNNGRVSWVIRQIAFWSAALMCLFAIVLAGGGAAWWFDMKEWAFGIPGTLFEITALVCLTRAIWSSRKKLSKSENEIMRSMQELASKDPRALEAALPEIRRLASSRGVAAKHRKEAHEIADGVEAALEAVDTLPLASTGTPLATDDLPLAFAGTTEPVEALPVPSVDAAIGTVGAEVYEESPTH